ncbi:hypothetical protein HCN44_010265 [Aphidius gifuensis]|uniref:Uncharacterized protein n=1 Tax=Aphidius gifuensis TaxID=684658 RepID=A0A834XWT0_APHGI|nr:uncharacterized protein LOC122851842 [Aphidius gifuensis]KAF7993670.1 hypothetical protein HCN44_010265 [Aphidius gifuensis]
MEINDSIEVMRDEMRKNLSIERKQCRGIEVNKNRVTLGSNVILDHGLKLNEVINKAQKLKKKTLDIEDYRMLQSALIQNEENINAFLSVENIIPAIIRDLSSSNPAIRLIAISCCCNIALGNNKACSALGRYAGPYLVAQLDSWNNSLLEVCIWTIGNLCNGSKLASEALHAQGCYKRLLSLLKECEATILPSVIYAIKHFLYSPSSKSISDEEIIKTAEIIINKLTENNMVDYLWILAILSSMVACRNILISITPTVFNYFINNLDNISTSVNEITAVLRIFANLIPEYSGDTANFLLNYKTIQVIFDKLLASQYTHVKKETLNILGNMYTHQVPQIRQKIKELIPKLTNLNHAVQLVKNTAGIAKL